MADSLFRPVANPVYTHQLTEPIAFGSEQITEIAIRKPTGMDMVGIGSPVISDPTSFKEATIDYPIAYRMASALSGLPEKVLLQAAPADMVDLFWKIGSFFIPGWDWLLPATQKSKDQPNEPSEQPAS